MFGWFNGNIQISVLTSQYQLNEGIFNNVGTFGLINGTSSSYNNIIVQTQIQNNSGLCVGALAGVIYSNLWKAQNISVDLSYITGNRLLGLLASSTTTGLVFECHFASSFIYANQQDQTFQGGIIGNIQSNEQIQLVIILCQVTNLSLLSNNNFTWSISGGLVGVTHANPAQITQTTVKDLDIQSYGEVRDYVSSASLKRKLMLLILKLFQSKQQYKEIQCTQVFYLVIAEVVQVVFLVQVQQKQVELTQLMVRLQRTAQMLQHINYQVVDIC
ncbi:Hypothetical_protein [Hexamita inflata]|uniref:Hypothetical_protein n=1 Tax=Hexamita inflata TaxID=28002 RepID=A0ABP1L4Z5_9EUKA